MPTRDGKLGVGITGIGWCAAQHLAAFQHNPQTSVTWLHGRDASRVQSNLEKYNVSATGARITTRYEDLLEAGDVDIIAIATPNHLHAQQAVAAARAGKHILLEKPTAWIGRNWFGFATRCARGRADDRVVRAAVQSLPQVCAVAPRSGMAGHDLRFAGTQYLSRVTDW